MNECALPCNNSIISYGIIQKVYKKLNIFYSQRTRYLVPDIVKSAWCNNTLSASKKRFLSISIIGICKIKWPRKNVLIIFNKKNVTYGLYRVYTPIAPRINQTKDNCKTAQCWKRSCIQTCNVKEQNWAEK